MHGFDNQIRLPVLQQQVLGISRDSDSAVFDALHVYNVEETPKIIYVPAYHGLLQYLDSSFSTKLESFFYKCFLYP